MPPKTIFYLKKILERYFPQKGQLLIELLLTIGLSTLFIPILMLSLIASRDGKFREEQQSDATAILKETEEAVRAVYKSGWSNIQANDTYYPTISGTIWTLAHGASTSGGFTRQVVISDVLRATASGQIVLSNGYIDPSTKKADITISWTLPHPSSVTSTLYLTRTNNLSHTDTTINDFNNGTVNGTVVAGTTGTGIAQDGQVQLGSSGGLDWCNPATPSGSLVLDLPGQSYASDIYAYQGHAFVTTGGNASGDSLDTVGISDPPSPTPPVATNTGSYNLYKTYGQFADSIYAYLTSDHPGTTVDIVLLSNLTHAGYFADSGGERGQSIIVATINNKKVGFVTAGSKLYSFDLSAIQGTSISQMQLGSVSLNGTGMRVMVATGSATPYAYIATNSTTNQLQIVNVQDPANMSVTSSFSMGNGQAGVNLFATNAPTYVYLVTSYTSGKADFFIVNITNPASPQLTGSYTTINSMNPKTVIAVPVNRAIIGGSGGQEYQVLDISNPAEPKHCGGLTFPSGTSAVQAIAPVIESDGDIYAYVLTNNASGEFQIIPGGIYQFGSGGSGGLYTTSGTFISGAFDAGNQAAFNKFIADIAQPANTTLKLQVAVATPLSGNCAGASFTYVGPDNTSATYYTTTDTQTISGLIPLINYIPNYQNPGRCFRYKAYFTSSDIIVSPYFYDMTMNYSP